MDGFLGQQPIAAVAEDLAQAADLLFEQAQRADVADTTAEHAAPQIPALEEPQPAEQEGNIASPMKIEETGGSADEATKEAAGGNIVNKSTGAADLAPAGEAEAAPKPDAPAADENLAPETTAAEDTPMPDAQQEQGEEAAMPGDGTAPAAAPAMGDPKLEEGTTNLPEEPVFVNLVERKDVAGGKPPKSHRGGSLHGHNYVIRFFLVDSKGHHHLAATGIDNGDSHYEYSNQTGFPALFCHNKAEVKKWADGIIARSQDRAGFHTDVICDEVPPVGTTVALPSFISYSESKEELPDGRHLLKWYLLDDKGHNHLALTGEEKETRDGHYAYHTEAIFELTAPLEAKNQDEVKKWLNKMLVKPQPGLPVTAVGPMALRTATQRVVRPVQTLRLGTLGSGGGRGRYSTPGSGGRRGRGRGRGPGRPPRPSFGFGSGPASGLGTVRYGIGESLQRQATTGNLVRRGRGGWKYVDPDKDARDLIAAELKRWVQEESARRETLKTEALAYAKDDLTNGDASVVVRVLSTLQAAAKDPAGVLPAGGAPGTHEQRKALVATIGALREISHLRASLSLLAYPELKAAVVALSRQQIQPDVASLAAFTLEGWLRTAVAHISVLAEPRYVQDPRPVLDNLIADQTRFDPVVTAITHRSLKRAAPGSSLGFFTPGSTGTLTPGAQGTPATSAGGDLGDHHPSPGGGGAAHAGLAADDSIAGGAETSTGVEATTEGMQLDEGQEGSAAKKQRIALENAPSVSLLNTSAVGAENDDARILEPFEQHLAERGVDF